MKVLAAKQSAVKFPVTSQPTREVTACVGKGIGRFRLQLAKYDIGPLCKPPEMKIGSFELVVKYSIEYLGRRASRYNSGRLS